MRPRAVVFDAYGTLFDVHSVVRRAEPKLAGDMVALSALWRQRQIEYTWLRSLMQRYEDFWNVTKAALDSAVRELQVELNEPQLASLMHAHLSPSVFPDVRAALELPKELPLAILSNGSPKMLESAVCHNGLELVFAEVISTDRVRTYKPSPKVYALATEILGISAPEILFVSSNWWDAWGAKSFGYTVCWCNRSNATEHPGDAKPDLTVARLDEISGLLAE